MFPEPARPNELELLGLDPGVVPDILTLRVAHVLALFQARKPPHWRDEPTSFGLDDLSNLVAPFQVIEFDRFRVAPPAERSRDPLRSFLEIQRDHFAIEIAIRNIGTLESLVGMTKELIKSDAAGVLQFEVDSAQRALDSAQALSIKAESDYRASVDELKYRLGLAGRAIVPDLRLLEPFRKKLSSFDEWTRRGDREWAELIRRDRGVAASRCKTSAPS